jgi:hypothetical protein
MGTLGTVRPGLRLESIRTGKVFRNVLIHIDGEKTWFRIIFEPGGAWKRIISGESHSGQGSG